MSLLDRVCRLLAEPRLQRLGARFVFSRDSDAALSKAGEDSPIVYVHSPRFFRRAVSGGSLGAAESYLQGEWDSDDLVLLLRTFARNMSAVRQLGRGTHLIRCWRSVLHWLNQNTRLGSRRNIAAHYDLSNDFFSLMLDPTMTYSCGLFEDPGSTMQQASLAKYARICHKLQLSDQDHLLEIGAGWGGFAIYAAREFGCRVTTTTISRQQFDYAQQQIKQAGLNDRITLLQEDYRDLVGRYDKLVSIEMIEAIGHRYLGTYFRACSKLLKPHGMMLLQAITIPDERYDSYRRSVDFIQRYIFPGGFLPSHSAIKKSLRNAIDLNIFHTEEYGPHYAKTLAAWRQKFWENIERVRELRFDDRFIRMWHYYLCYCEAGFHERQIGLAHFLIGKSGLSVTDRLTGKQPSS